MKNPNRTLNWAAGFALAAFLSVTHVAKATVITGLFDGTPSSGTVAATSDPSTRPQYSAISAQGFIPSSMASDEVLKLSMVIDINAAAASWQTNGNLVIVGLLSEAAGLNNVFAEAHESQSAMLYYQNNSGGSGVYWNDQFYHGGLGGSFVFGQGALGGYPYDNLDGSGTLNGSYALYDVEMNSMGQYKESIEYLNPSGNPISSLFGGIGSNPQTLFGSVDPNNRMFAGLGIGPGDGPAGWAYTVSDSQFGVFSTASAPEPGKALFGFAGLAVVSLRRRRKEA